MARALRGLPRIAQAYSSGRLSWDQLRPLTRFATPETDERWAVEAADARPAWLWRESRRHERVGLRAADDAHRGRYLRISFDEEAPVCYIDGRLGAEQGAAVERALGRHSEHVELADEPDLPAEARMADALVELVTQSGGAGSGVPVLVVHAQAEVLSGDERSVGPVLAETDSGVRLASESVVRLACDCRVEWMLERDGRPVGIGRKGRVVPAALGRALRFRDGGRCRFPGCRRKRWLVAHHLWHWGRGGPTDLDNLVLLCHSHHRLLHEGGWRTSGHPGRDLRFHDPTGRPLRPGVAVEELVLAGAVGKAPP